MAFLCSPQKESVLRHCFVMTPKDYAKASNEGDDIFLCEYEYDIHWRSFKRLADIDDEREEIMSEDGEKNTRTLFLIEGINCLTMPQYLTISKYPT